ncbi:MAG: hypothetical protein QOC57_2672 [Ilumatobacteraceae bacterium]
MAARARILSPTVALRRNAIFKGLLGGSRGWMAVGAIVWAPRFYKRVMGRVPEFVAREVLQPGQTVCITAIPPPAGRREARRARKN